MDALHDLLRIFGYCLLAVILFVGVNGLNWLLGGFGQFFLGEPNL